MDMDSINEPPRNHKYDNIRRTTPGQSNHLLNQLIKPEEKVITPKEFVVTAEKYGKRLEICINSIVHLLILNTDDVLCLQAYYDGENDSTRTIEIYFKNQSSTVKLEYDADNKWKTMLNFLSEWL